MFQVNGEDFPIYSIDTKESIKNRIARKYNTLSEYLGILPVIPDDFRQALNLNVTDYLKMAQNDRKNLLFSNFYEKTKEFGFHIPILDMFKIWLAYNNEIVEGLKPNNNHLFLLLWSEIEKLRKSGLLTPKEEESLIEFAENDTDVKNFVKTESKEYIEIIQQNIK